MIFFLYYLAMSIIHTYIHTFNHGETLISQSKLILSPRRGEISKFSSTMVKRPGHSKNLPNVQYPGNISSLVKL